MERPVPPPFHWNGPFRSVPFQGIFRTLRSVPFRSNAPRKRPVPFRSGTERNEPFQWNGGNGDVNTVLKYIKII